MKGVPVRLILALVGLALLGVLANAFLSQYLSRVLIVTGISVIFVASLAISNGFTGVFSLGHPAFIAIGAYTSGILTLEIAKKGLYLPDLPAWLAGTQLGFLPATLIAGLLCALVALVVGYPLMRLSGNYVSVATLGLLVIVNVIIVNADNFTRGSRTFTGIPDYTNLWWVLGWVLVTLVVLSRVAYSSLGRAMRATREDAIAAQAMGILILPTRLLAFTLGAFFAGVGGALYGHYLVSFSPATFYVAMMVTQLTMLVLGGQGSLTGATVGVVLVTALSEILRNLERGVSLGALQIPALFGSSQIVLGLVFILVMVYRPQGLLGNAEIRFWSAPTRAGKKEST